MNLGQLMIELETMTAKAEGLAAENAELKEKLSSLGADNAAMPSSGHPKE